MRSIDLTKFREDIRRGDPLRLDMIVFTAHRVVLRHNDLNNTTKLTRSRNNHLITTNDDYFLTGKKFLCNDARQAAEEVVPPVDNFGVSQDHFVSERWLIMKSK
mmetsp:Transcript_34700/g.83852  ORF Transcript_34700/g.83852 Transcript_34700/m.83852 type:complete len:104 (+) Transcript_34700:749-1060(+)